MQIGDQMGHRPDRNSGDRPSIEEAFAEATAKVPLEGMDTSGPIYQSIKAQVIAGEIDLDQAVELLRSSHEQLGLARKFMGDHRSALRKLAE